MSARFLADYMAASRRGERTILTGCKFIKLARGIQHQEAKAIIGRYLLAGETDPELLTDSAQDLRDRLADDDFERDTLDYNADYVQRFAEVSGGLVLPLAYRQAPGSKNVIDLSGVTVTLDLCMRLNRTTKTNQVRVGAVTLRYGKGKALSGEVGDWQSSLLFGYLQAEVSQQNAIAERKLCLTVDAYKGVTYPAPGDAVSRFKNMAAACATIADAWPNIAAPRGAIL